MEEVVKETFVPEDSIAPVAATGLRGFVAKFTVLKGAQRELWLTFLIKFLIYTAYSDQQNDGPVAVEGSRL